MPIRVRELHRILSRAFLCTVSEKSPLPTEAAHILSRACCSTLRGAASTALGMLRSSSAPSVTASPAPATRLRSSTLLPCSACCGTAIALHKSLRRILTHPTCLQGEAGRLSALTYNLVTTHHDRN